MHLDYEPSLVAFAQSMTRREELQGYWTFEFDVLGLVDDPHAATADLVDDPELASDEGPRLQDAHGRLKGPGQGWRLGVSWAERRRAVAAVSRIVPVLGVTVGTFNHNDPPLCVSFSPLSSRISSIFESSSIGRRQLQLPQQLLEAWIAAQQIGIYWKIFSDRENSSHRDFGSGRFIFSQMAMNLGFPNNESKI